MNCGPTISWEQLIEHRVNGAATGIPFPRTPAGGQHFQAAVACYAAAFFISSIRAMSEYSIMPRSAQERSERAFQQRQEGAIAFAEYQTKEQATRLLTAKLRAERLARESKTRRKREA